MSSIKSISNILVEKYGLSKRDADQFVVAMFAVIKESLLADKQVKVKGLGTFKLTEVSSRQSVDVNTGERIVLDGRSKVSFTPENAVRDRINAPFSQFESFDIVEETDFDTIDKKYSSDTTDKIEQSAELEDTPVTDEPVALKVPVVEEPVAEEIPVAVKPVVEENPVVEESEQEETPIESQVENKEESTPTVPLVEQQAVCPAYEAMPVADTSLETDELKEELKRSNKLVRTLTILLIVLVLAILCVVGYWIYNQQNTASTTTAQPDAEPSEVVDTTATSTDTIPVVSSSVVESSPYDEMPELKNAPYRVASVTEHVITNDYTLDEICYKYAGMGTQIYVQAVNEGRTEFHAGETIKIPHLEKK